MRILGIESSCDETGVAVVDTSPWEKGESAGKGLLAEGLYSQIEMHQDYGGVVPELASRDHIRRIIPLIKQVLKESNLELKDLDAIGYTQGPGLAGALLVGASVAKSLGLACKIPAIGIHHLEGHLLSPLLSDASTIQFPFVALLVSGGHTQLMRVNGIGDYVLLGDTLDDAAGEAFDKTAKMLGLPYPGGPTVSRLAEQGQPIYAFPRPMLHSGDLNFSFAGLKTSVLNQIKKIQGASSGGTLNEEDKANICRSFVDAMIEVLVEKSSRALAQTGLQQLVVAGGVGANSQLRSALAASAKAKGWRVEFPPARLCTDNGAMIAFAAALRLQKNAALAYPSTGFEVKPRWPMDQLD